MEIYGKGLCACHVVDISTCFLHRRIIQLDSSAVCKFPSQVFGKSCLTSYKHMRLAASSNFVPLGRLAAAIVNFLKAEP